MPGAWEIPTSPEVLVAILTREIVSTAWAKSFREMVLPPASTVVFLSGMPFDHARNNAVEEALRHNFKWLFFLDDDVLIPNDAIRTLISNNADIVSGLYYRRNLPIAPVALMEARPKPVFIDHFTAGSIMEVDLVGAGCLLISRKVLQQLKSPWFEWRLDKPDLQDDQRCSEDFAFCREAKKAGFKILLDTRVQCQHVGLGRSSIGGEYLPVTL
jgi:hypothetical protein